MPSSRFLLVPLALIVLTGPTSAGIFTKKPKPNPAERVPELLIQLKTGPDETVRENAAEELRQYDPTFYPEIVTSLIDALGRDTSTGVRSEAAASLGKLRPVTQKAGYALEQAQNNDASIRVRMAARQALWQYHLVGYRGAKPDAPPEKPAMPTASAPPGPSSPASKPGNSTSAKVAAGPTGPFRETPEPPLADPLPSKSPPTATPVARPKALAPITLIPSNPPKLIAPPKSPDKPARNDSDGPALSPPY